MNETALRWKGRIGALKPLAVIILIILLFLVFSVFGDLNVAFKNRSGSQPVSVAQLVSGQVDKNSYVSVSGLAVYRLAYTETEDGTTKAIIYPLVANDSNDLVFVRTANANLINSDDTNVTISGLAVSSSSELQSAIEQDLPDINSAGLRTSSTLYIEDGRAPGQLFVYLLELAVMAFFGFLCLVTFFFPSIVFGTYPVQPIPDGANIKTPTKATGTFRQVKKLQPNIEFGRSKRKFQNSNANLITFENKNIGVYIHFIYSQRVYGIRVYKQETDWMIILAPAQIVSIEPGKIYSWRDQWAVLIKYRSEDNKDQSLYIHFEDASAQAGYISHLRSLGYPVASGQYATGTIEPTWR